MPPAPTFHSAESPHHGPSPADLFRILHDVLNRDLLAKAAAAVFGLTAVYYLGLILAARQLYLLEERYPFLLSMAIAVLALFPRRGGELEDRERKFWVILTTAFTFWWAVIIIQVFTSPPVTLGAVQEVGYILYYVLLAFSAEYQPDRSARNLAGLERLLAWPAVTAFVLGLFAYFVLIPMLRFPELWATYVPSMIFYVTLDAYITMRFIFLYRRSRSPRWRSLYLLLATAMGTIFVLDLLETQLYVWKLPWAFKAASDFSWCLLFFLLALVARSRHHPSLASEAPELEEESAEIFGTSWQTMISALVLPLVHYSYYTFSSFNGSIEEIRESAVVVWLLLIGSIALVQHRYHEKKRRDLRHGNMALSEEIAWRKTIQEERERLIAELEARNAEIERFAYTLSHDLRTPLFTIQGFLGLLKKDIATGDEAKIDSNMAQIRDAAVHMKKLFDELLDLWRVGRILHSCEQVPLEALAREAVALLDPKVVECGARIDISDGLPVVFGDRARLLEVFKLLLDNALRFAGSAPPMIEIGGRSEDDLAVVEIRDNGRGIDSRYHQKVFGLFEQLDPAAGSTSIGLALVRRIVEMHGGRAWIESDGDGHGTTVCFTLASDEVSPPAPRSARPPRAG